MSISPFFRNLRSAYFAEIDDLSFDSEGLLVLAQRLRQRRKEISFLVHMLELSPEMVAVVFHKAFRFTLPGAMEHLLQHEAEDLPPWSTVADTITVEPWAQELVDLMLKQAQGEWFMSVAASLEYLYNQPQSRPLGDDHDADDHCDTDSASGDTDSEEEAAERTREEAGADWMAAQGFDRKDTL